MATALVVAALSWACERNEPTSMPANVPAPESPDPHQAMFARGYYPGRSGQIFFILERGDVLLRKPMGLYRFMHGGPWDYDRHIPLIFYGPGFVTAGARTTLATQQDVASTLLSLVGVPPVATMSGRALELGSVGGSADKAPGAVMVVVLDGMREDYLERYRDVLPNLTRLVDDGASFPDTWIDYLPTVTSAGHTTIATGADPRIHGIAGNGYYDRRTHETRTLFEGLQPSNMMVLGLADVWATTFGDDSVVIAQGTTPRATVSLAGHGRCRPNGRAVILAMFDYQSGSWTTNPECYVLPDYLRTSNAREIWESTERSFRDLTLDSGRAFVTTDLFPEFQIDALVSMLEQEQVGRDDVADLVLVNMKTPDYVGHYYGPDADEMREALAAIDRGLARVLETLEAATGARGFVVAVTADHGMPPEPDLETGRARRFIEELLEAVHQALDPEEKRLLYDYVDTANLQLYVDDSRRRELGLSLDDIAAVVRGFSYVRQAFTENQIRAVAQDSLR